MTLVPRSHEHNWLKRYVYWEGGIVIVYKACESCGRTLL